MTDYELWSLVLGAASLLATVLVSFAVFYMGRKGERNRVKHENEDRAREFIIRHGDGQMLYLPYCVIASGVNRHHRHVRQIYNDFSELPDGVQREVLRQENYEIGPIKDSGWVQGGIEDVRAFIAENRLGDDLLYDGGKYFTRSMDYASEPWDPSDTFRKKYPDVFGWGTWSIHDGSPEQGRLSWGEFLESYYTGVVVRKDAIALIHKDDARPIDALINEENLRVCDEDRVCYWMMEMVDEIVWLIMRSMAQGGHVEAKINGGDAQPETYEDRYYASLMELYNLSEFKKSFKPTKPSFRSKKHFKTRV